MLDAEKVALEMNKIIEDVASVLRLSATICRLLLHHYKWNKESLLERYVFFCSLRIILNFLISMFYSKLVTSVPYHTVCVLRKVLCLNKISNLAVLFIFLEIP